MLAYYRAGPSESEIGQLSEVAIDRSITVILTIVCSTSLKTTAIAMAASVVKTDMGVERERERERINQC